MKAEDFLHSKEIESATCLTNKATYYLKDLVTLLNEYARIQIDKDRERVKLNARVKMISYPIGDYVIVDPESIDNTPINLD